ncbi:helix-turn-helix transcriptional regulator [Streptomyces gardneri]|uniref:TetR/AcrR family transcriptional regulator n=1 Tax=Nocardia TaxID=1817 RepID=UPI001895BBAB|nr:helix-turn-helix domain-containing protein [Nocardia abscessus]MBF6166980.1 helix-turn-helix transcriptional regulator [Streptomyces gardneri]MBF6221726.1 helix-turn-helix transcriptional regulator [Nocardia abscessus]MBF6475329.1 helix-turn-helix transcriptional regulator [Nocardia abscessus]
MTATGTMTSTATPGSRAQANRRRILDVATGELARNPAASMEEIATAAGVVRRTLYGHFPTREALIDGILDLASEDIASTLRSLEPDEPVTVTTARCTIALWRVGDKYRLLLRLTEMNLGARIDERLTPVHEHGTAMLRHGQQLGVYSDHLPAEVLSRALAGLVLALLEARNHESWNEPEPEVAAARACLITLGVTPGEADEIARTAAAMERAPATPGRSTAD